MRVDAKGKIQEVGREQESQDAKGLILSVDYELQKKIFDAMIKYLQRTRTSKASAIALDPRNGQVLALISLPSFDNNLLSYGISSADYKKIFENPDQPLFNRAVSGQYPPGSTIKPFLGAASLEEKIVKPSQTINDTGAITLVNQYTPSIVYRFPDWKTHGAVDIYSAIAQSCDIYFYYLGGGFENFKGLGLAKITKYLRLFGFGSLTDIDLPSEKGGFVPNAAWKKEVKKEDWFIGDTYHISIGQGDLTATPLQLAVATAAIANNGVIWQPKIVDKIVDSEKNIIDTVKNQSRQIDFISLENIKIIQRAMRQTVVSGTAQILKDLPKEVAGKTGTAQVGADKTLNSLFISFAPFSNPEIVLVIIVEGGGEGNSTAATAAKDIYSWYFTRQ
jgi:penicillin-binding protein 2